MSRFIVISLHRADRSHVGGFNGNLHKTKTLDEWNGRCVTLSGKVIFWGKSVKKLLVINWTCFLQAARKDVDLLCTFVLYISNCLSYNIDTVHQWRWWVEGTDFNNIIMVRKSANYLHLQGWHTQALAASIMIMLHRGHFNIKMLSHQYRNSYYKDKTVSSYHHYGNP